MKKLLCVLSFLLLIAGCAGQGKQLKPSDIEAQISKSGLDIEGTTAGAVAIEHGGTNAVTAANALTNLGAEPADATILKDADIGVTVQGYSANLDAVTTPGSAGTFLKSDGTNVSWDVAGGSGGGTISGTLGSTDNVVLRSDGTGGVTAQGSLMTLSDAGSPNIPTGQTYNINGSAHTHNYQPLDSDLTLWGAITPSANMQSLAGAADYSAIRTLLSLVPGTNVQAYDADLLAIAGITRSQGSLIVGGAAAWEGLSIGAVGKVLKSTGTAVAWGDDNNDGGSAGISSWDELEDSAADATIALGGYKTIFTSTLDTGSVWTMTNTDASLSATTSLFDMKVTADGDANLFFLRGYDNSGGDLKWSIGPSGAFYGYSFETAQSATGGTLDFLEGSGGGTNYVRLKAPDALAATYQQDLQPYAGSVSVTIAKGALALATSAIASGACQTVTEGSVNSVAATGIVTTDVIQVAPNGSLKAVTGYAPGTAGGLTVTPYPTAGYVNVDVCNWSADPITPGAVTVNWIVIR